MYSKLSSYGFSTGLEFTYAIQEGVAINSKIVLGDRDVDVTLSRLSDAISATDLNAVDFSTLDKELGESVSRSPHTPPPRYTLLTRRSARCSFGD